MQNATAKQTKHEWLSVDKYLCWQRKCLKNIFKIVIKHFLEFLSIVKFFKPNSFVCRMFKESFKYYVNGPNVVSGK